RIGKVHANNLMALDEAETAWVADPFIDGAKAIAERCGAKATASPSEALQSGDLDGVVIASPTSTHADLIEEAIKARVPVLCEKPIELNISRVDELGPFVRDSGVPVAVGFNRRLDHDFTEARRRVAAGEIGALEQLAITSRDPVAPPPEYTKLSGGIFRDMTI